MILSLKKSKETQKAKIIAPQNPFFEEMTFQFETAKITYSETLPLNFQEIAKFLQETHRQRNAPEVASKYTML